MLIKALYDFFQRAKDDEYLNLEAGFAQESVNLKIVVDELGNFQSARFIEDEKDENGRKKKLLRKTPRTTRPTNGGDVAEFLCAGIDAVFGLSPNPEPDKQKDPKKLRAKHSDFWNQIETAYGETSIEELKSVLEFRNKYFLDEKPFFLEWKKSDNAKKNESASWWFTNQSGETEKLKNANAKVLFAVSKGIREKILITDNQIVDYWRKAYQKEKAQKEISARKSICLVTEETNASIADSHLPKVKIMGADSYLVSSDKKAFDSYGLEGGYNASISISAVEAYSNALTYLLADQKHHLRIGDGLVLCFWAKAAEDSTDWIYDFSENVSEADVKSIFTAPKKGIKNYFQIKDDEIYSVVFGTVKGRIIVYDWLQTTVEKASDNFVRWFEDLYIKPYKYFESEDSKSPFALSKLAKTTMRRKSKPSKSDQKIHARIIIQLYESAMENKKPSLSLMSKILFRIKSEIAVRGVDYTLKNYSRFALLKLIINRYTDGENMENKIQPELTITTDSAYNCGRLLAVLADIQAKAHGYSLKTGMTEKFFGAAMKSPQKIFPRLLELSNYYLGKIRRSEKFAKHESFLRNNRNDILVLFQGKENHPPDFKAKLTMQEQGRFTIGFFQQMAHLESEKNKAIKEKQLNQGAKTDAK